MCIELPTLDAYVGHYAATRPDDVATIAPEGRLTYVELDRLVARLAGRLREAGIRSGDRVAVLSTPRPEYFVLLNAIVRAGGIYVGLNPRHTVAELAYVVDLTKPAAIFALISTQGEDLQARVSEACRCAGHSATITPFDSVADLTQLCRHAGAMPTGDRQPSDPAVIVFTSGSTGRPKGATLHHGGLIGAARSQWSRFGLPEQRILNNLPINHVGCIVNLTYGAVVGGGALVFQDKFDPGEALNLIERHRVNVWVQVPAMFQMAVNHPDFTRRDLSSLQTICCGGGPLAAATLRRLRATDAMIFVEYGQTEVMSNLAYSDRDADDQILTHSVGRFYPAFEVRIADPLGRVCEVEEIGEIQARGNCVMLGYWDNPEATRAAFTVDGWLKTGDLAYRRVDGNVVLKGRLTEMIKSGGYNLYPREIEMAIETHPAIAGVVVVGLADQTFGEAAHAVIESKPGSAATAADLKAFCTQSLANYKTPRSFRAIAELPRLPNGKIDRTAVKQIADNLPLLP